MKNERADAGRDGRTLSCETNFSGANGDREPLMSLVQLTTSRTGDHTWLIHARLKVLTIHTCIHRVEPISTSIYWY